MVPYARFDAQVIRAFETTQRLVASIPSDFMPGDCERPLRCHELARAVFKYLDYQPVMHAKRLTLVDGRYGPKDQLWIEHSWLELALPFGSLVLDPYVPGELPQVQLRDSALALPQIYREGESRTDIDEAVVTQLLMFFDRGGS